jgi:hypothetical protein
MAKKAKLRMDWEDEPDRPAWSQREFLESLSSDAAREALENINNEAFWELKEWYGDEVKRREVVVRFFERRLNRSLRLVPGTVASRLLKITKQLQARGKLHEYLYVMRIVEQRVKDCFPSYIKLFSKVPMTKNAIKQTLRRLDRVARELFPSDYPAECERDLRRKNLSKKG